MAASAFRSLRAKTQASIDDATSLAKNSVSSVLGSKSASKGPTEEEIATKKARLTIPKRDTDRPLRILSLDGGGVRGYSALLILDDFMARIQEIEGTEEILPADYFDLIIGTSTGGIMALMLGRLRMTVKECLEAYRNLAREVFSGGIISSTFNAATTMLLEGGPSIYNEDSLEKSVKATVKKWAAGDNENALLLEPSPDACRAAIVTALSADATRPVLMRSYTPGDPKLKEIKIWEAARATSAAPIFFKPIHVTPEKISYIDGAVSGNSNPSLLAIEEAEKLWPNRKIGLFLSLGTGSPSQVALQGQVHQLVQALANLSTNTIHVHEKAVLWFQQHCIPTSPYVRFTVENQIEKVRLDDHSSLPRIAQETAAYLQKVAGKQEMEKCIQLALATKLSLELGKEKEAASTGEPLVPPPPAYEPQASH
ncbi:Phospholipase A I [Ceratobasidium theobromae]|uniref:Phospholipase A I n=1 Tax=Ceratobasidium theobromae TaxID=1582974 RepID=A0A5N5QC84_9AGAM|nr:Phospholipase A I [Ceratobasidium theobromae]